MSRFTFECSHNDNQFRYCAIMRILILLHIFYNLSRTEFIYRRKLGGPSLPIAHLKRLDLI
jgi:hypothetical protein